MTGITADVVHEWLFDMTPDERDRLTRVESKVDELTKDVQSIAEDVKAMRSQANMWKGGMAVLLGLGGFLGAVGALLFDSIPKWMGMR